MSEESKILIVEDEPRVASVIKRGLEKHFFSADIAFDGYIGKEMALNNHYDLILLDINLPQINGFELCKEIRKHNPDIPIIIVSALGSSENKLTGFDIGIDDYIVKPFDINELIARIKVRLKRSETSHQAQKIYKVADLEINTDRKTVSRADKRIDLTPKEYLLLEYFVKNKGVTISRTEIAFKIWGINFESGTNFIDVYINYLRKKIDKDFTPKLIHTKVGMGYYLNEEEF